MAVAVSTAQEQRDPTQLMDQKSLIHQDNTHNKQHGQTKPKYQRRHDSLRRCFNAKGKRAIAIWRCVAKGDVS
jgi:hypothetical protein